MLIEKKEWESNFFGLSIYELVTWNGLDTLEGKIEKLDYDLIECNLSFSNFKDLSFLESIGFRTVDSRISFLTLIDVKDQRFLASSPKYKIRPYLRKDFEEVLEMTHKHLTFNDSFVSRYKNTMYYPGGFAEKYFKSWISKSVLSEDSITVVAEFNSKVVGFFIIEKKTLDAEIPVWKGRLTAVDKLHRGNNLHLSMQSKIFELIPTTNFYLDNTTQLSNIAVVKNHIKSNRKLESMSLNLIKANVRK